MIDYIVYKTTTGEISRTGICQDSDLSLQASIGESVIEGTANDLTQKIDVLTENVVGKTTVPSSINKTIMNADGIDSIIISNLPNPTRVSIAGEGRWIVDDGVFEFTTDTAGEYEIKLLSSLYISVEYVINAS